MSFILAQNPSTSRKTPSSSSPKQKQAMNSRLDLRSILPYLPPIRFANGKLTWPNSQVTETLTSLSKGPTHSRVDSGATLFLALSKLRDALSLSGHNSLVKDTHSGFANFFDDVLPKEQSSKFIHNVIPALADSVLRLPSLLEGHYRDSDRLLGGGVATGLRLLDQQQPGFVFLDKELIGSLLSCSLFCLYPKSNRSSKYMRTMNFDQVFASIHDRHPEFQENKLKCMLHYFEKICSSTPSGLVSFERKVLSREPNPSLVTYPSSETWANSAIPLCKFEVFRSGSIEDHPEEGVEVNFADEYCGGIVMSKGCAQEEIRFMMNPELIAGILFLPSMLENEAIEIVGTERYSKYTGYRPTFKFDGNYEDRRPFDSTGRRMSRILSIDALRWAGTRQYQDKFLLREVNKAYCGFLDHPQCKEHQLHSECGVISGNWGCGIFRGDPQVKSMIQWIAASQAGRPSVVYYTFNLQAVRNLDKVCEWIVARKWTVGDLWKSVEEYCSKRVLKEISTNQGYFAWLRKSQ